MDEFELPDVSEQQARNVEYEINRRNLKDLVEEDNDVADGLLASHIGIPHKEIIQLTQSIDSYNELPTFLYLTRMAEDEDLTVDSPRDDSEPDFMAYWFGEKSYRVRRYGRYLCHPQGSLTRPFALTVGWSKREDSWTITIWCSPDDQIAADDHLRHLLKQTQGQESLYKNEALMVDRGDRFRLLFVKQEPFDISRSQLIFSSDIWKTLDHNVSTFLDKLPKLKEAGLGTNRGILLAGPPGTGKTAVCKVLSNEWAGKLTTVICKASAGSHGVGEIYEALNEIAPAIIFIEDLDLLIGNREFGNQDALMEYLAVLDGLMTRHENIITIASTNRPDVIDIAARRSSRFDEMIQFVLPDENAREAILRTYLEPLDNDVDCAKIARETEGMSGADLRELVRRAFIRSDRTVLHETILGLVWKVSSDTSAASSGWPNQYL